MNWQLALLTQNPFLKIPPSHPEEAIWAGFPDLKKQLDSVFTEAFSSSRTQVILNRGEFGSGKTHAAIYTRRADYLNTFKQIQRVQGVDVYYVRLPKEPEKADMLFYRNILEAVQFRRLRIIIKEIITNYTLQIALEKLQELTSSEALGRALWLLGLERDRQGQLTLLQEGNESSEQQKLLESFFFSQTTKGDLKKLGLRRDINSSQDRFHVLGCLLQCLIGLEPVDAIEKHRRIILWIDEMEDLINYPSRYHKSFIQGLRDLFDRLPDYFTIMMNFTLALPDHVNEIGIVAGKGFLDRITHQIHFKEPDIEEAFEYVKDLMRQYRTEDFEQSGLSATYPFREDALRLLITNLPARAPYDINQRCAAVIEEALKQGIIHNVGEGTIDTQFVRSIEDQYSRLDME